MATDARLVKFYLSQIRSFDWGKKISNREQGAIDAFIEAEKRLSGNLLANLDDLQLPHCARLLHIRLGLDPKRMPRIPKEYVVSETAREQFRELNELGKSSLEVELQRSSPIGNQKGETFLRFIPCGLVAVGVNSGESSIITGVVTRDQAVSNIKAAEPAASSQVENAPRPEKDPESVRQMTSKIPVTSQNALIHMAARHAIHSTSKKERHADLIARGIDFEGPDAKEYRRAFSGAKMTFDAMKAMLIDIVLDDINDDLRPKFYTAIHTLFHKLEATTVPDCHVIDEP